MCGGRCICSARSWNSVTPQAAERRGEGLYRFLGWLFQEVEKKALPGDENRCKIEENT